MSSTPSETHCEPGSVEAGRQIERWQFERLLPDPHARLHSGADPVEIGAIVECGRTLVLATDGHPPIGYSFAERTNGQDHNKSGAAHGEKAVSRH